MQDTINPPPLRLLVGVPEAIIALSCKRTKLYEHIQAGRLRSFKLGGKRLFRVEDLQDFAREASNGK